MLRAAAKNFLYVTVIVDPADYPQVIAEIKEHGNTTLETRFRLAVKVFQLTSSYDTMRETIRLIRSAGDQHLATVPIIIGGNQLNEQVCEYVEANYWVNDAMTGVRLCQQMILDPAPS